MVLVCYALAQWEPVLNFKETVEFTVDWYRQFYEKSKFDAYSLTSKQIEKYLVVARKKGIKWTYN